MVNDRPGSLINLLTYLFGYQASIALIGSRRRIGVNGFGGNVSFIDEDRILMENLYVVKGYGAQTY